MEDPESSLTTKDSNTSIASDINKLEIDSQNTEIKEDVELKEINENLVELNSVQSSDINETVKEVAIIDSGQSDPPSQNKDTNDLKTDCSSSSEESGSTTETEPSSTKEEQPQKRKRKRKRRRKRKAFDDIAAYTPDEPFTKRYKKTMMELSIKPKLHVKFDEIGNIISYQNNYKPRIISALPINLSVTESSTKEAKVESIEDKKNSEKFEEPTIDVISLKPRIIKAIGT